MAIQPSNDYQVLAVHPGLAVRARDKILACANGDCRFDGDDPAVIAAGVAVIPVKGVLVHADFCWCGWGVTSYAYIRDKIEQALANPAIRAIALVFNSPGGIVSGCFDLADFIRASRSVKPIIAYVDESCFSAAYALASSCSRIVLPRTGCVGSIGVITVHASVNRMFDTYGIDITEIYSGSHKADGSPYAPLDKGVKAALTKECDDLRRLFAQIVADGRDVAVADVLATEAMVYRGDEAVKIGLADEVAAVDVAFDIFCKQNQKDNAMKVLSQPRTAQASAAETSPDEEEQPKESGKKSKKAKDSKAEEDDSADDDETMDAEEDSESEPDAESDDDDENCGKKAQVSAEQRRIEGILTAPEAKGRETLAQHLAFRTRMGAKEAVAMLATAPVAAPSGGLAAKMPPNVVVGAAAESSPTGAQAILHSMKQAGFR